MKKIVENRKGGWDAKTIGQCDQKSRKRSWLKRWDLSRLSQFGSERFHVVVVV